MMKEQTRTKTRTYRYNRQYSVDIVDKRDLYEAWLYKPNVAHKLYMFGFNKKQPNAKDGKSYITLDDFIDIVERAIPEYVSDLKEDVEALEEYHNEKFYR